MNGPAHYTEAERLLERAEAVPHAAVDRDHVSETLAAAQVHATLALAAATAAEQVHRYLGGEDLDPREWTEVLS